MSGSALVNSCAYRWTACCVPDSPYAWYHCCSVVFAPEEAFLFSGSLVQPASAAPPAKRTEPTRKLRRFMGLTRDSLDALGDEKTLDGDGGRAPRPLLERQRPDHQAAAGGTAERLDREGAADLLLEQVVGGDALAGDHDPLRAEQVDQRGQAEPDRVAGPREHLAQRFVAAPGAGHGVFHAQRGFSGDLASARQDRFGGRDRLDAAPA